MSAWIMGAGAAVVLSGITAATAERWPVPSFARDLAVVLLGVAVVCALAAIGTSAPVAG